MKKCLLLFVLLSVLTASADAQKAVYIGKIDDVAATFKKKVAATNPQAQRQISQLLPGNQKLVLKLNSQKQEGTVSLFFGEVSNTPNSSFYLKLSGSQATGAIVMKQQKKYYSYSSGADGSVYLTEKDIDKVLCIGVPEKKEITAAPASQTGNAAAAPPSLQSLPGADAVLYLDFDGQTVTNTLWNSNFNNGDPIVAEPADLSEAEMTGVWKMVSEDFRPFELNVTTSKAVFDAVAPDHRMRVIFTPTDYFFPGYGGVAYVGSFTFGNTVYGETPCWVWNTTTKYAGEAGSHESGHTLGLSHDGRTVPQEGYFQGQQSWAPIMGVGYYKPLVQWSKGEYPNANNTEDDLAIISSDNGFGYRTDDHGNSAGSATPLVISGTGSVSATANKGVITTRTDTDVFSFTTSGGSTALTVNPDPDFPDLDVYLTLRNASNTVVATANPSTQSASLNVSLAAGNYYLTVDGTTGSLGANSDYASLGAYSISGTIPTSGSNKAPTVSITSPANNAAYTAPANIVINATASDADGTVANVKFYNGTTYLRTDFTAPYSYTLSNLPAGTYSLTAKATDDDGAQTISAKITVVVNAPNEAPAVSITSPANNATYNAPANIVINATAADTDGTVANVKFYNGSTYLRTDFAAPYSYTLTNLPAGTYTLTAKATDNDGAQTISAAVKVTVKAQAIVSSKPIAETNDLNTKTAISLKVFPNPAAKTVTVSTNGLQQNKPITISILSATGNVMKTINLNTFAQNIPLDVSSLTSGAYIVKVLCADKVLYKQFIKL